MKKQADHFMDGGLEYLIVFICEIKITLYDLSFNKLWPYSFAQVDNKVCNPIIDLYICCLLKKINVLLYLQFTTQNTDCSDQSNT